MSKSIDKSIEIFINQLQARIDLFNSSTVSSNVDNNRDNFNKLIEIISGYTDIPVQDITLSELYQFSLIDIKKILKLIGTEPSLIDELIDKIKLDSKDLSVYELIRTNITLYAKNFLSINETQNELIASKIEQYQKYIDLFKNKNYEGLFDQVNDLMHIMTSISLGDEDMWPILRYIAQKNAKIVKNTKIDVNVLSKAYYIINKYIPEEPTSIHQTIVKYISNNEIDIDLIPSIAESIATEEQCSKYDVQNCLVSFILSTLCDEYTKSGDNKEELISSIKDVLEFIIPATNEIIMISKEILKESRGFMSNCIESGNTDFEHYQNTTITELAQEYDSRETAIDLKKIPILKTISETLDHIEKCTVDSEEYNLCCSTLVELIDTYNLVDEKKKDL